MGGGSLIRSGQSSYWKLRCLSSKTTVAGFSDFWDRLRRDYISASGLDWLQDAIKRRFNRVLITNLLGLFGTLDE